ncbi:MAG: two-component regulator propeller domain-containing protein [Planctomycetota bacterium]
MTLRATGWLVVASLCTSLAPAAESTRSLSEYSLNSWTKKDGLPLNSISDIVQTRDGYLWLASERGLVRFDGARFTVFDSQSIPGLTSEVILGLYEDRESRLWIGTAAELLLYQYGRFTRFGAEHGLPADCGVNTVFQDSKGVLWLSTFRGLYTFTGKSALLYRSDDGISVDNTVSSIVEAPDGSLWLTGREPARLHQGKFELLAFPPKIAEHTSCFYQDPHGQIWIGTTGHGVYRAEDGKLLRIGDLSHDALIHTLAMGPDGELWLGAANTGVSRFLDGKWETYRSQLPEESGDVTAFCIDREGNAWFSLTGRGLFRLSRKPFWMIDRRAGLTDDSLSAATSTRDGTLWVGSSAGVIESWRRDGATRVYGAETGRRSNSALAMAEDSAGAIWVSYRGTGIQRCVAGRFEDVPGCEQIQNKNSLVLLPRGDEMLIAADFDVYRWRAGVLDHWFSTESAICAVVEGESADELWVGTYGRGVVHYLDGKTFTLDRSLGLASDLVICLRREADSLWIGSFGGGLQRYRAGHFESVLATSVFAGEAVFSVIADARKNLWIGGNDGVTWLSGEDLAQSDAERRRAPGYRAYGFPEGISAGECHGGSGPQVLPLDRGCFGFVTPAGIAVVDPEEPLQPAPKIDVHVEAIKWAGSAPTTQLGLEGAALPADVRQLEIRYTGICLTQPERLRFRYRMRGYEKDWIEVGERRTAVYSRLPPGAHTFEVCSALDAGAWSDPPTTLALEVAPAFHQRWQSRALLAAAIVLCAIGLYRLRIRQLVARQRQLEALVLERTANLESARAELATANSDLEVRVLRGVDALRKSERMAAYGEMVAGVAHEVRHPLFALEAAAYVLTQRLKDRDDLTRQTKLLELETRRIGRLMDDLLQFARPAALNVSPVDPAQVLREAIEIYQAEHGLDGLQPTFSASDALPRVPMDAQRVVQVVVNLMENARKHAKGATQITLSAVIVSEPDPALPASPSTQRLQLSVQDDGCGIPQEHLPRVFEPFFTSGAGTGLGLAIVQRVVADHGGRVQVESRTGNGTKFTLELPMSAPSARPA